MLADSSRPMGLDVFGHGWNIYRIVREKNHCSNFHGVPTALDLESTIVWDCCPSTPADGWKEGNLRSRIYFLRSCRVLRIQ